MKRLIAAIAFALFAGAAFAAGQPGPSEPYPLDMRDPLMDSASGGASLPELAGSTGAARMLGDLRLRPLPGERARLARDRQLERRQYSGPRSYWENDPLFIAPWP